MWSREQGADRRKFIRLPRLRSELEPDDPMEIWRKHIAEELDAYMDLIFERVVLQAFLPHAEGVGIRVITWSLGICFPRNQIARHPGSLKATTYNDVQLAYSDAFKLKGLVLEASVNNLFGVNLPVCLTCALNGYDAGTYDLPGAFWNVRAKYRF